MKKILTLLICINIFMMPAYCTITDDFAETYLDKNLKIKNVSSLVIEDEFAENTLDKNLQIKSIQYKPLSDIFAEKNTNKNSKRVDKAPVQENLPQITKEKMSKKLIVTDTSLMHEVKVRISESFTTKQEADEGDYINFITIKDIKIGNTTYPKGSVVKARIETISPNKSMGVPADLVVGNFTLESLSLAGEISKTGANRSLWARPCMCAFMLFWGAGLLFIPIRGGHAKIRTSEIYTLYAE